MLNKKILLIIVILNLLFIPQIRALENNTTVNFSVSFEESIDINKIEKIFIMMDDAKGQDYEVVLERNDNFNLELKEIDGDVTINSISVYQDYLLEYEFEDNVIRESENEVSVKIVVRQVIKDPNKEPSSIDENLVKEILGDKTTSKSSTTTTTEVIIPSKDNEGTITKNPEEEKEMEEQQKIDKQKENQAKRNSIYKIILVLFLTIIIIIILVAIVKIANANK